MTAEWEAADMVHRNRLGLAREAAAASTVDVLNRENRELQANFNTLLATHEAWQAEHAGEIRNLDAQIMDLRRKLTVATCAALAANEYYKAEYMGEKTYLTPTETRERFGSAMVAYREATGADSG